MVGWRTAAAALIVFALVFYRELLIDGRVAVFRDQYTLLMALDWVVRLLSQWEWPPLWTPFQVLGKPLAAEPLAAVWYPPNWPLRRLPFPLGWNASIAVHHLLAAAGLYALLRHRDVAPLAAALGALLFAFGGMLVSLDNMLNALQSAAWAPWTLLAFDAWLAHRRRAWLVATAAGLALTLLGGMPEVFLFELLLFAALAVDRRRANGPPLRRAALGAAAAVALAAGFGAVQFLPSAEYLLHSSRSDGLSVDGVLRLALQPLGVFAFLLPRHYLDPSGAFHETAGLWEGDLADAPWALSLYLGPLLALIAAGRLDARRRWPWLLLGAICMLLALGDALPGVRWLVAQAPLLRALRYPEKTLLVVHGLLAVGAALGLDAALREPARFRRAAIAALALGAGCALAAAALWWRPSFARDLLRADLGIAVALSIAVAGLALLGGRRPAIAGLALLALAAADLWRVNGDLLPTVPGQALRHPPATLQAMVRGDDPLRIYSDGVGRPPVAPFPGAFEQERSLLLLEVANYFAVANLNAPASINLRDHERLAELIEALPPERLAALLAALNTAYVTSPKTLGHYAGLEPVLAPAAPVDAYLYRVAGGARRAYVPAEIEPLGLGADALAYLRTAERPAERVAVAAADVPLGGVPARMRGTVTLAAYRAGEVELDADMETAGLVVLSDTFYPGWEAEVDGAPTPIVRANYFARGVFVGRGQHRVVFRYAPDSFRNGWWISAVSLAAAATLLVLPPRRQDGFK